MIKLTKTQIPQVLAANGNAWKDELLALPHGDPKREYAAGRYNHPEIKAALKQETSDKCCYCESDPLHVDHGDIEHILPKSTNSALCFEWKNLTLACGKCNNHKRDKDGLVDPYADEPTDEFRFAGPLMMHVTGRAKADRTIVELNLNRKDLLAQRGQKILEFRSRVAENALNTDANERDLTIQAIARFYTSKDKEFSACVRDFAQAEGL